MSCARTLWLGLLATVIVPQTVSAQFGFNGGFATGGMAVNGYGTSMVPGFGPPSAMGRGFAPWTPGFVGGSGVFVGGPIQGQAFAGMGNAAFFTTTPGGIVPRPYGLGPYPTATNDLNGVMRAVGAAASDRSRGTVRRRR